MKQLSELERLKKDREYDTEWLGKYKRIIDGLQQIAEINSDACNDSFDDWTALSCGLNTLSKLIQEDINGRKEESNA